ncbi:MAG: mechanosensitive ion channel family protein, partial [Novosphingobium sp.]
MATSNNTGPLSAPRPTPQDDIAALVAEASAWVQAHWLQIAIAAAAAAVVYLVLNLVRSWGVRLCQRSEGGANWYGIIGRALSKTSQLFIILAAARLVQSYANAPQSVSTTIATLFTIAAVFQGAIWVREIALGAIENRTFDESHQGQALASALGIIRLLVTIVLFAIAVIVILSNLGVNVAGLVAGLGVG